MKTRMEAAKAFLESLAGQVPTGELSLLRAGFEAGWNDAVAEEARDRAVDFTALREALERHSKHISGEDPLDPVLRATAVLNRIADDKAPEASSVLTEDEKREAVRGGAPRLNVMKGLRARLGIPLKEAKRILNLEAPLPVKDPMGRNPCEGHGPGWSCSHCNSNS